MKAQKLKTIFGVGDMGLFHRQLQAEFCFQEFGGFVPNFLGVSLWPTGKEDEVIGVA